MTGNQKKQIHSLERLHRLELQSLEHRRLLFDLIFCYKIVFGIVDVTMDDFLHLHLKLAVTSSNYIKTGCLTNQSKLF